MGTPNHALGGAPTWMERILRIISSMLVYLFSNNGSRVVNTCPVKPTFISWGGTTVTSFSSPYS